MCAQAVTSAGLDYHALLPDDIALVHSHFHNTFALFHTTFLLPVFPRHTHRETQKLSRPPLSPSFTHTHTHTQAESKRKAELAREEADA